MNQPIIDSLTPPQRTKSQLLRDVLFSEQLEFIMEAHNGLVAKIVEDTGFKAIWASGLTMSASMGVRDCNEIPWGDVLTLLGYMNEASSLPILVDADTGYGDFNIAARVISKMSRLDIAGACIEDKIYPKRNSFAEGDQQLCEINEFCAKLFACKAAQATPDFCVVARTEALITGAGMEEALRRAKAYHAAGADAILIHSKKETFDEVARFASLWDGRAPLVVVPTTYNDTPSEMFQKAGISTVIWANHLLRASVPHYRDTARQVFSARSVAALESKIAPVKEVFHLQNQAALEDSERLYFEQASRIVGAPENA